MDFCPGVYACRQSEIKGFTLDTASRPAARPSGSPHGMIGAARNQAQQFSAYGFPDQLKKRPEQKVKPEKSEAWLYFLWRLHTIKTREESRNSQSAD